MAANMVMIEKQHVGFMKGNFLMFDRSDDSRCFDANELLLDGIGN